MKKWIAPVALTTLMAGTIAVTVSGNALAHGLTAKHGGIMKEVAGLQFELVASKDAASAGGGKNLRGISWQNSFDGGCQWQTDGIERDGKN